MALWAVFASAVLHAAWNALLKRQTDPSASSLLVVLGAAVFSGALALGVGPSQVPASALGWVGLTGLIEAVYFISLSQALKLLPLGTAYGLSRGAGLLFLWPLSLAFFGESLDAQSAAGAACVCLGLLWLVDRAHSPRGLSMALVCAASISSYPLAYKQALEAGVAPFSLFALSLTLALPLQLALLPGGRARRLALAVRDRPLEMLLAAGLCAASFLLFLVALRGAGPGRITALRNTSVVFASVFGWLSGEKPTWRTGVSAVAITTGAVLLSG